MTAPADTLERQDVLRFHESGAKLRDSSFNDPSGEKKMESRPRTMTPEIALKAAQEVAADMKKYGCLNGDDGSAAQDIAKYARLHMDGYQLAKELDDHCYWGCDLEVATQLDSFHSIASQLIAAAEKEWAERNSVVPPLPSGTVVKLKGGETGTVDGVYEYGAAKFLVKIDGDPAADGPSKSRRIVNFEDCAAVAENAAER